MERITKVFFDPLATTKEQVRAILQDLSAGSAHPFSPERILLLRTATGIDEIDISSYAENFFFNAVDLGELGETLLRRMAGFPIHLAVFNDYAIQQAPSATFKVPIVSGQIACFAVSELTPTYFDFCIADKDCNVCCWLAQKTFSGVTHSGDIIVKRDLLDYIRIDVDRLTEKELAVFISGFTNTKLTRFLGSNPVVLVPNHEEKVLYIIPVPLDAATIGDSTICCPLVVKKDGNSLVCSILASPTTDRDMYCHDKFLKSDSLPEAVKRADFVIAPSMAKQESQVAARQTIDHGQSALTLGNDVISKHNAVFSTTTAIVPLSIKHETTQVIRFGTGLEFVSRQHFNIKDSDSSVILPCIFGSRLQGPILLATGKVPSKVPFSDEHSLRKYYDGLKNVTFIVDGRMTDNARNLAGPYRINALFIVQVTPEVVIDSDALKNKENILSSLNSVNINEVTALAGPQSLVLVQIGARYFFYRGIANRAHLNTASLCFGDDVTAILQSAGAGSILDARIERLISLDEPITVLLPSTGQKVLPNDLKQLFEDLPLENISSLEEDISAAVPQLQAMLSQTDLQQLSIALITTLSTKVSKVTAPLRNAYVNFVTNEYDMEHPELVKKKNQMLGELRKKSKKLQQTLETATTSLSNMISSQTTSKRTHDLQRLQRQTTIANNVEATKNMTFEKLAEHLENHAEEMGVMVLNIETTPYATLLDDLKEGTTTVDAGTSCDLDSRLLHLEGLDAGIIMEQSQASHDGPLKSQFGPTQPTLALPYLSQNRGSGSMLAWVCWDEFVNLESPFTVRWMDKCNEPHIAALRIMMRGTLSNAVVSREYNFAPGSLETGHLMSALLMAGMEKLAAMRTSSTGVTSKAEDTVTKLMRGLFGNLLTIAGSGVRPLSMVWQLFGKYSQFDLPSGAGSWRWYESVVVLYPYTGWPLKQFHENLEKLLDKMIIRVVTKNEKVSQIKAGRSYGLVENCKNRNIQLEHCRTILHIFMRILTKKDLDVPAVAGRLLGSLPRKVENQTKSYPKMIKYIEHLADGGARQANDDLTIASVFTKRSATFRKIKARVASACKSADETKIKNACQALVDMHTKIATLWNVKPKLLKVQNLETYQALLAAKFGDDIDEITKKKNEKLIKQALGDAEQSRVPWQVGKEGEFGENIEPLDETFVNEILTGETSVALAAAPDNKPGIPTVVVNKEEQGLAQFASKLSSDFITKMEKDLSPEAVCDILGVPATTMKVFVRALNPAFVWDDLGESFKAVILHLVKERSDREGSRPTSWLLNLAKGKQVPAILELEAETLQIAE